MGKKYQIDDEKRKGFAGIYLLDYMINTPHSFPIFLADNDVDLEPVLEWLMMKNFIEIKDEEKYIPTQSGRDLLKKFLERYYEYLKVYDVYCAVDLEAGEFAFSSYDDFEDENSWKNYIADQKWDDLRIAVAEYKKLDPVEIVFMSFINEQRFGRDQTGWQFDLLLGSVWDEILEICNTAIHWEELGYEDDEEEISANSVIEDIICQGAEIMIEMLKSFYKKNQQNLDQNINDDEVDEDEYVDKVYIDDQPVSYYEVYMDPFYVSPYWNHNIYYW